MMPTIMRKKVVNLEIRAPNEVYKPARGIFRRIEFRQAEITEEIAHPEARRIRE